MYQWLDRQLEGRSVVEMSIMHTLVGICSLLAVFVLCFPYPSLLLTVLILWFIFLVWFWVGLVKTAWRSSSKRLGIPIFRYLQIAVLIMLAITVLPTIRSIEEFKIIGYLILAFDIAIAWLVVNFLFLAWFARCKIPFYAYCEIGTILAMVVFQIWLLS